MSKLKIRKKLDAEGKEIKGMYVRQVDIEINENQIALELQNIARLEQDTASKKNALLELQQEITKLKEGSK